MFGGLPTSYIIRRHCFCLRIHFSTFVNSAMHFTALPRFVLSSFVAAVLLLVTTPHARAQWISDSTHNTVVCDTTGTQDNPVICSDGFGWAIVAWQDSRSAPTHIYAQRLDAK